MTNTTNTEIARDEQVADGMRHLIGAQQRLLRCADAIINSPNFDTYERVILLYLVITIGALDMDRELSVYGTIDHLKMNGRTVRAALHRLTAEGYIITTTRTGRANLYRVPFDKMLADPQEVA